MFSCRYCACNVCFGTKKILKPFRTHVLKQHPLNCSCDCVTCASGSCRSSVVDLTWIQSHLLCPKQQLLHGSDRHYFPWSCLELKCDTCFLYKAPSLLVCDWSAFTDPTIVTKWEKWEQLDYTQRNMVVPAIIDSTEFAGISNFYGFAVTKGAPIGRMFYRFTPCDCEACSIGPTDEESKRLVLHCDFSQDLSHAMADQSMCEYFDIISSSLFVCVAHFWGKILQQFIVREQDCLLYAKEFSDLCQQE